MSTMDYTMVSPFFFLLERRQPNFFVRAGVREIFSAGKLHPVGIRDNIY